MITSILLALLGLCIHTYSIEAGTPVEFVVLVTSYNNEQYVERNLDSIFCQEGDTPFEVIYVNDASTDRTGTLVEEYAQKHALTENQLLCIHNSTQLGSGLGNIYNTVHNNIADHKVVVCIDGDDYFAFPGVLKRLTQEYADDDVWMTYGRFIVYPACEFWSACWGYSDEVIRTRSFRQDGNVPSHIKTFRAKLFKQIDKKDLIDETGNFYKKAWDMAMMFPLLEMCAPLTPDGINHSRFIADTVLYIYNFSNPLGDAHTSHGREEQIRYDRLIRAKKPYEPLRTLDLKGHS